MRSRAETDDRLAQDAHRPRVIHTGQALVDLVIEVADLPSRGQNLMADSVAEYAGGSVTVLLAAARLGAECLHAGAIGTGPYGDLIREALDADGIAASAPPVTTQDTGVCVVLIEPSAERTFVTTLGAEREISVDSLATADVQPGDLVCVTGYSLAVAQTRDPLLAWLKTLREDAVVVLDPGAAFAALPADVRDAMLDRTDVWTGNAEEATDLLAARSVSVEASEAEASEREIVGQARALSPLLRAGAVTIVRDGAEGCAVCADGQTTYVPGFPQTPVDTVFHDLALRGLASGCCRRGRGVCGGRAVGGVSGSRALVLDAGVRGGRVAGDAR
ncbi:PfkB family carbohydrate kinase [Microbacterium profundi]|uniref:PfkB family carbohydrate kinase n=1 Tax=Microbacterium profundi TaxID=450380 RepID=A0ABV3LHR7_9MICO